MSNLYIGQTSNNQDGCEVIGRAVNSLWSIKLHSYFWWGNMELSGVTSCNIRHIAICVLKVHCSDAYITYTRSPSV
jgi:hypothetical protein